VEEPAAGLPGRNGLPRFHLDILYDRSDTIRESYTDVEFTMVLTLGLVVMVIFLFLRNLSATIIPSLALPFSIVGTFAVMYLPQLQPGQSFHDGPHPSPSGSW